MKSLLTSIKNTMHNKILFSFILVMLLGLNIQTVNAETNNPIGLVKINLPISFSERPNIVKPPIDSFIEFV